MKTIRFTILFALVVALFTACSKDDDPVLDEFGKPQDNQTYTIMMYGCGGGNLDQAMIQNLEEAYLAGASDRVNFVGQINFSKAYQEIPSLSGTLRFKVGPTPNGEFDPVKYSETPLHLAKPENLTEFIEWAKKEAPADQYILLLWNHGGGWAPEHDGPDSRSIIYDDNFTDDKGLKLHDLVKGVKDSNTHFKMIYFDACLMGQMEVLTGVKDYADYAMCATHITPGLGGDYNSLIYHLGTTTNFEDSMKEYCRETMSHWNYSGFALDFKVINLKKMDKFLGVMKDFSGFMKELTMYVNQVKKDIQAGLIDPNKGSEEIFAYYMLKNAVERCYLYDSENSGVYTFYDLIEFAEYLTAGSYNPFAAKSVDLASRLNRSWNEAVVCYLSSNNTIGKDFSVGVTIVSDQQWIERGYEACYPDLEFDKLTGWSNWLRINPFPPVGNPNPNSFEQQGQGQPEQGEGEQGQPEGEGEGEEGQPEGEEGETEGEGGETEGEGGEAEGEDEAA